MRAILFAAAVILLSGGGPAEAEDNPACARFENPLEYNACLAKQGPRAGATLAVPEPGGAAPAPRSVRPIPNFGRARRTRGRMRMEFTVRRR
jgi:hypothetical protein